MRVERVPTATSRMSRKRCSTPISSASSASIIDGVCTKVLVVVVPSYKQEISLAKAVLQHVETIPIAYIFDFFHRKVGICGHADFFWLYIDND